MPAELVLAEVVRNPGKPPGPSANGLVLEKSNCQTCFGPVGGRGKGGLALLGEVPALFLVVSLKEETFVGHDPHHR